MIRRATTVPRTYEFAVLVLPARHGWTIQARCGGDKIAAAQAKMLARNVQRERGGSVEVSWQDSAGAFHVDIS